MKGFEFSRRILEINHRCHELAVLLGDLDRGIKTLPNGIVRQNLEKELSLAITDGLNPSKKILGEEGWSSFMKQVGQWR